MSTRPSAVSIGDVEPEKQALSSIGTSARALLKGSVMEDITMNQIACVSLRSVVVSARVALAAGIVGIAALASGCASTGATSVPAQSGASASTSDGASSAHRHVDDRHADRSR